MRKIQPEVEKANSLGLSEGTVSLIVKFELFWASNPNYIKKKQKSKNSNSTILLTDPSIMFNFHFDLRTFQANRLY